MDSKEICQEDVRTVFDCISPKSGTIMAAVIADILADGFDSTQITVLAAFITSIGDLLGYIAAQTDLNEQILERQKEKTADLPLLEKHI